MNTEAGGQIILKVAFNGVWVGIHSIGEDTSIWSALSVKEAYQFAKAVRSAANEYRGIKDNPQVIKYPPWTGHIEIPNTEEDDGW